MKILRILTLLTINVPIAPHAFAANPTDAPGIGIDRIEKQPHYYCYYSQNTGGDDHSVSFGVYNTGSLHGAQLGKFWTLAGRDESYCPTKNNVFGGENARTITNDIRRAILDETLFNTLIDEGNYGEAWRMSPNNEQGALWRRRAIARAKTDIEKYIRRAVFEEDPRSNAKALTIVQSFVGNEPHHELNTLLELNKVEAARRREELLAQCHSVKVQYVL